MLYYNLAFGAVNCMRLCRTEQAASLTCLRSCLYVLRCRRHAHLASECEDGIPTFFRMWRMASHLSQEEVVASTRPFQQ